MKSLHILVSGRVQGVSFRYYTVLEAEKYGLTGWVRNLNDGRVEVLAQGREENLSSFLQWCHKGSPSAQVTNVEYDWPQVDKSFAHFEVLG